MFGPYAHSFAVLIESVRSLTAASRCGASVQCGQRAGESASVSQRPTDRSIDQSAAQNSAEQWPLKYSLVGRAEPNLVIVTDLDDNRPRRCKHRVEHSRSMQPLRARSLVAAACRQSHSVLTQRRTHDEEA